MFAPLSAVESSERYNGPIIDMHLHAQDEIWADSQLCFPQPCISGGKTTASNTEEVRKMTIEAMNKHNIVLGFLSGEPADVADWVAAAPNRFIASPMVFDPTDTSIEQLRKGYELGHFAGMGEIATQYLGFGPSDDEVLPFFALANEFDVPAHVHTLGIGAQMPTFRVSKGDPRLLEGVLVRFPNLRVFSENCGFPFADEMTAMMYQYPQLYCDISTILHLAPRTAALRHLKQLVDGGLDGRIMFGSDQMIWPEVIPVVIEALQSADFLSTDQKADIFYNNAARFLRLSDDEVAAHHSR